MNTDPGQNSDAIPALSPALGSAAAAKRPTIEELERILSGAEGKYEIQINPDGSLTTKPINTSVVDAAVELCVFCKMNGYPKEMTPEFFRLTELVDRLDTALRRAGLMGTVSPSHY